MQDYIFKQWYFDGEYREKAVIEFECDAEYLTGDHVLEMAYNVLHKSILTNPQQMQRERVVELAGMLAYDFRIKAITPTGAPKRFMCQVKFRKV